VTAGDVSFPLVLARTRRGGCRFLAPEAASGIVDLVSSKTARLRRRQAAQRKRDKRLRKSDRVPQHTRTERRREEVERQRWQEAHERQKKRLRRAVFPVIGSIGAAGIMMFMPLAGASRGHNSYLYLSAAGPAASGNPDLPHVPESDGTYYSSLVAAGTARTNVLVGPVPSEIWNGSERYGSYGPNIFGD
jgi:hypothetical protein